MTLVYCGQMVGRIKMKLGTQVGLGPGHIVLDADPQPPIFGRYLLWPNGCMDQDATWYGGRPWPRPHCARLGPSSPPQNRGHSPPVFGPCLWPNGWMDVDASCHKCRPQPRPHCVTWGPSSPQKEHSPQFLADVCCGQMVAHLSYC